MYRYRNTFFEPLRGHDPEFYSTKVKPVEYRGHLLFHRIKGVCWDVVRDGDCIAQYRGRSGAEEFVDRLMDGDATERDLERAGKAR